MWKMPNFQKLAKIGNKRRAAVLCGVSDPCRAKLMHAPVVQGHRGPLRNICPICHGRGRRDDVLSPHSLKCVGDPWSFACARARSGSQRAEARRRGRRAHLPPCKELAGSQSEASTVAHQAICCRLPTFAERHVGQGDSIASCHETCRCARLLLSKLAGMHSLRPWCWTMRGARARPDLNGTCSR